MSLSHLEYGTSDEEGIQILATFLLFIVLGDSVAQALPR